MRSLKSMTSLALLAALFALPAAAQVDIKVGGTEVKVDASGSKIDVTTASGHEAHSKSSPPPAAAEGVKKGKDKVAKIEGVGVAQELVCEKSGLQKIEVTGTTAKVTVKGECKELEVTGAQNEIVMEFVEKVHVTGANNVVKYKGAVADEKKKKKTQVKVTGSDNKVDQIKPAAG